MSHPSTPAPSGADAADPKFRADVHAGLSARPRAIPARWFYDKRGSELFEAITALPEYYPTRTERAILKAAAPEIAEIAGPGRSVVEFGAGAATKTPILLAAVAPEVYVPVDISGDFLHAAAAALAKVFPHLKIRPIVGDFTNPPLLPDEIRRKPRLGFFPGSTIGNLCPDEAIDLLRAMAAMLGKDSLLLIGIDRIKDPGVLLPAYNDAEGVTAAFNRNLLHRINAELDGSIPVEAFRHRALWNDAQARIEMHLEATQDVAFTVDGRRYAIGAKETIHTENSHKYGPRDARLLLRAGGWTPIREWCDAKDQFCIILAQKNGADASSRNAG